MSDDSKGEGFKVEDKRRFDSDGVSRGDDGEGVEERAEVSEEQRPEVAEEPAASSDSSTPGAAGDLSFSSFIVGLATQAFMFLGAVTDPKTGLATKDLGQAKALIDIIGMLAGKTAGNLTEDEARMMEEMLYELRMQYVNETRAPAPATDGSDE